MRCLISKTEAYLSVVIFLFTPLVYADESQFQWEEAAIIANITKPNIILKPTDTPREVRLAKEGVRWARLVVEGGDRKGQLEILDASNARAATLDVPPGQTVVTQPLSLPLARLRVSDDSASVTVAEIIKGASPISVESWVNGEQLRNIGDESQAVQKSSKGIAIIEFVKDGKSRRCNGFAISNRLIATNDHCIGNDLPFKERFTPRAYFDFTAEGSWHEIPIVGRVKDIKSDLDLALLIVPESATIDTRRILKVVSDESTSLTKASALRLLQYYQPDGWVMRVSYDQDCRVWAVPVDGRGDKTDLAHGCDCEKGTSGAPLLRATDGAVVGLHHLGNNRPSWDYNRGIRIGLLKTELNTVKATKPELFEGSKLE